MEQMDSREAELEAWLREIAGGDSINAISKRVGVPQRTLANHVKSGELTAAEIVAIARAYGASPVWALVDRNVITQDEVEAAACDLVVDALPIRDLLDTAVQRLDKSLNALDSLTRSTDDAELILAMIHGFVAGEYRGDRSVKPISVEPLATVSPLPGYSTDDTIMPSAAYAADWQEVDSDVEAECQAQEP